MPADKIKTLEQIVLELTSSCNNRCSHCYNYWVEEADIRRVDHRLSRQDVHSLVKKVKADIPLKQVALSGGEPMMLGDLPEIVCDLVDEGLSTAVITNGTLLTKSRLRRFPVGTPFEVTILSADERLHNEMAGRRVFQRVLEGLVNLEQLGGRLVVGCVVTRRNAHDITRTIELGIALGAQAVMLNRVNLNRRTLNYAEQLLPTPSMLRECLGAAEIASKRYGIPIAVSVPIPPCFVEPGEFPGLHFGWCPRGGADSYYTVGWNGAVRPCNHSSAVLGDLRTQTFSDIITGPKAREFWAPIPEECLECEHPLKDMCKGGCPAAADECFGTRKYVDPMVALGSKPTRSPKLSMAPELTGDNSASMRRES